MKKALLILAIVALLFVVTSNAQVPREDTWTRFFNADSTLFGFKDTSGTVRIEPKFVYSGLDKQEKFDDIIVVCEGGDVMKSSYYLNKSGQTFGRGSIYFLSAMYDCESEGFIRFRDQIIGNKRLKIYGEGMFDRNGRVVIPADYDYLSIVRNGMVFAGRKKGWGRNELVFTLIDTMNRVLVENLRWNDNLDLNFYSLEKGAEPNPDTITKRSFRGVDGLWYSFIDYKKEFDAWLKGELLSELTKENLTDKSYYRAITWSPKGEQQGWVTQDSKTFIDNNFEILAGCLSEILDPQTDYFMSPYGLNRFMYTQSEFAKYFANNGEYKDWVYPIISAIVYCYDSQGEKMPNSFSFLRTDEGYKLIEVSVRNVELKC